MNKKLLLKVKERILNEKIPVVMDTWLSVKERDAKKNWKIAELPVKTYINWCSISGFTGMTQIPSKDGIAEHGCKTAGCIAGHAIMEKWGGRTLKSLAKKYPDYIAKDEDGSYDIDFSGLGQIALELDWGAGRLFSPVNWPEHFYTPYYSAMRSRKYKQANKIVAARIDHFIATGE